MMPPRKRARTGRATATATATGGKSSVATNKKTKQDVDGDHQVKSQDFVKGESQSQSQTNTDRQPSSSPPPPPSSSSSSSLTTDPALLDEEFPSSSERDETKTPATHHPPFTGQGRGYNALKSHHGQLYTGMSIGASHTWNYDQGIWKETKKEPDLWEIDYRTTKRRARNAPKGSGAPVGTEYHWLIVGHQHVKKIDANTYETHLTGSKYKLAHKTVSSSSPASTTGQKGVWSIPTVKAQRDREVELLEDAKRRVLNLPPVLGSERVKVELGGEKGQQKLDALFLKAKSSGGGGGGGGGGEKRKREDEIKGEVSIADEDG